MIAAHTEISAPFEIGPLHTGTNWPALIFEKWSDAKQTVPEDFIDGTYSMGIYVDPAYLTEVMSIAEGPDLVIEDNMIAVYRNEDQSTLPVRKYFFRILCVVDADDTFQVIHGTLNIVH